MLTAYSSCSFFIRLKLDEFDESQRERISIYDYSIDSYSDWKNNGKMRKMKATFKNLLFDFSSLDTEELSQVIKCLKEEIDKGEEEIRNSSLTSDVRICKITERLPCLSIEIAVYDKMQNVDKMLTCLPSEEEEDHRLFIVKSLDKAKSYLKQYFESLKLHGKVEALIPNNAEILLNGSVFKTLQFKKKEQGEGKNVFGYALLEMKYFPKYGNTNKSILIDTFIPTYMKNVELIYNGIPLSFIEKLKHKYLSGRHKFYKYLHFGAMTSVLLLENKFDPTSNNFKYEDFFMFFDEFFNWIINKVKRI